MRNDDVCVYRFMYHTAGQDISPRHMWGTAEAIAQLPNCIVVEDSERRVHAALLDRHGFYFEQAGGTYIAIEEPRQAA